MASIPTKTVTLKDGTSITINVTDFDPSIHNTNIEKKAAPTAKRKTVSRRLK